MNIGIFTNAYKPTISGVVNSIELIKTGMEARGHRVFIFAPRHKGYQDNEKDVYRFLSVSLTSKVDFPLPIPYSFKIFRMIPKLNLDVIHTHHPFILGEVGADFARKLRLPLIYTFHTQFEQYSHYIPFNQDIVKKITRSSVIRYAQKCNLIICPSTSILALLKNYGITSPVEMIPNAINIDVFRNPDSSWVRKKFNIADTDKTLIYVGRIGLEKNLGFMLKAFKKALNDVPEARLMIVGEGPELEALKDLSKSLEIEERTIFPGRVEYKDIPSFYGIGYAFLMTSTTEVKPLALLEAMAAGLPVIAISASGSSDTITQNYDGILTENNMDSYVSALLSVLKDPAKRDKLGMGARQTSEKYSISAICAKIEEIYQKMIKEVRS